MHLENILTAEKIPCAITRVTRTDLPNIKAQFTFDWRLEFSKRDVFKITLLNAEFIHGLISFQYAEEYLLLSLIELNKINIGRSKLYDRVAGSLIGFAAGIALEKFEGYMKLVAKSVLIANYERKYGFTRIGSSLQMISYPANTKRLVTLFYEDEEE